MIRAVGLRTARRIASTLMARAKTSMSRCTASAWSTTLRATIAPPSSMTKNVAMTQSTAVSRRTCFASPAVNTTAGCAAAAGVALSVLPVLDPAALIQTRT